MDINQSSQDATSFSKRLDLMSSGLEELENWLLDTLRQGLASLEQQPDFWKDISARMVDAKLSGVGRRLKILRFAIGANPNWYEYVLTELGGYYLLIRGLRNIHQLPPLMQIDLLRVAGVNTKKESLFSKEQAVKDIWMVMATSEEEEDNLRARRTWLYGWKTNRYALVLDFVWGRGTFTELHVSGTLFEASVFYYPSNAPLRVAIQEKKLIPQRTIKRILGFPSLNAFLDHYADVLAANPWLNLYPCALEQIMPTLENGQLQLIDINKQIVPIEIEIDIQWKILALSGGHPLNLFGEWTGVQFIPLSASVNGFFSSF